MSETEKNHQHSKYAPNEDSKSNVKDDTKQPGSKVAPEEEVKVTNPTKKLMKYMRKELSLFVIGSIA